MDESEADRPPDERDEPDPRPPMVKRRWAIVRKTSGGVAVLAVAGAMAFGDSADNGDPGQEGSGSGSQISAES